MTDTKTSPAKRNCDGQPSLAPATGSATCAWWIDDGDDEEAWHITCDRPATHHVSQPGRCKMPLCSDHVKIYQSSPEKYTVEELPNEKS